MLKIEFVVIVTTRFSYILWPSRIWWRSRHAYYLTNFLSNTIFHGFYGPEGFGGPQDTLNIENYINLVVVEQNMSTKVIRVRYTNFGLLSISHFLVALEIYIAHKVGFSCPSF
ncbi:hypothetical protein RYX36_018184 [Vicia faba]